MAQLLVTVLCLTFLSGLTRAVGDESDSSFLQELGLKDAVPGRSKRALTKEQQKALLDAIFGNRVTPSLCPAGYEAQNSKGKQICYQCPSGSYWKGATRKCVKCPLGFYNKNQGTIDKCTPCPVGTFTAEVGAVNSTFCVERCPVGQYSKNGMMEPINCIACPSGTYTDKLGTKSCSACPSGTTTSSTGAKAPSDCKAKCPVGHHSGNGLTPCDPCPLNTYQDRTGQKFCLDCPLDKTTLLVGASKLSQCLVIYECTSDPCKNGGTCVDGNNRYICNCPPGYTGDSCEIDIDDCESAPCWNEVHCIDKVNDFQCVCPAGWQGKLCNKNINECNKNPCKNNGDCIDINGGFECSCRSGFGGQTCSFDHEDCIPGVCLNGATCNDKVNGFVCQCRKGFRGEECGENIDNCEVNGCRNGAKCVDGINKYTCSCAPGYKGSKCEIDINECQSNPCKNTGICTDVVNDYRCTCPSYKGGKDCSRTLSDCFNLYMVPNSIEDYVVYDPPSKLLPIGEFTIKYTMKSTEVGLDAHYGAVISYGLRGREDLFNIRMFPEHMLQINGQDWLTRVSVSDGNWHTVCLTWRASDGRWRSYDGLDPKSLTLRSDDASKLLSKSRVIDGGGKFVIGQLYQGVDGDFGEQNIFKGELTGLSIWYKWDQCKVQTTPSLAWPNLVYNGEIVTKTNRGMLRTGVKAGGRC